MKIKAQNNFYLGIETKSKDGALCQYLRICVWKSICESLGYSIINGQNVGIITGWIK